MCLLDIWSSLYMSVQMWNETFNSEKHTTVPPPLKCTRFIFRTEVLEVRQRQIVQYTRGKYKGGYDVRGYDVYYVYVWVELSSRDVRQMIAVCLDIQYNFFFLSALTDLPGQEFRSSLCHHTYMCSIVMIYASLQLLADTTRCLTLWHTILFLRAYMIRRHCSPPCSKVKQPCEWLWMNNKISVAIAQI